jgi:hypothetical protein
MLLCRVLTWSNFSIYSFFAIQYICNCVKIVYFWLCLPFKLQFHSDIVLNISYNIEIYQVLANCLFSHFDCRSDFQYLPQQTQFVTQNNFTFLLSLDNCSEIWIETPITFFLSHAHNHTSTPVSPLPPELSALLFRELNFTIGGTFICGLSSGWKYGSFYTAHKVYLLTLPRNAC